MKSSGGGEGFLGEVGLLNNYPYRATTHMPADSVLFGNFQDLLVANYGSIQLESTSSAGSGDFAKATTTIRAIIAIDIAVRHPVSFVLSTKT